MTFIKICGITNLEDALVAVDAGADALGFNFYGPSPRYISPQAAREIVDQLPQEVLTVGVFVNEPSPERVRQIAGEAGVVALQLHGSETPDFCRNLKGRYVIKALSTKADFTVQQAASYEVDAIMLDAAHAKLHGGTGQVSDWDTARQVREVVPKLFLAGGLSPENIAAAVSYVRPYGVDACSALEDRPGRKNHERMRLFVKSAQDVKP
jgi:phosphoribosylanthranilate isomerase